jgi:predicted Zn-dependent protease
MFRTSARHVRAAVVASSLLAAAACARNPATGERQLSLISEAQEIQMGREAAAGVKQSIGFVDDAALQQYVQRIGLTEAKASERPGLPWEFHIVDDPAENAFALPGGFIYVTRGMMNLMTSEAELAGVLGHEIGHVTARHSVNQLSKQQLAQLGLGLGGIFFPQVQQLGPALGAGLNLLFLKYSRDDERQADQLGFEYMRKQDYDVSQFGAVFAALERRGEANESALPAWLTTHPAPAERVKAAEERAGAIPPQINARVGRDAYLQQIDDLVYGRNPRQGFFRGSVFYHPDLRFQLTLPQGWQAQNLPQAVVAMAPDNRAAFQLMLAGDVAPEQALGRFLSASGIRTGRTSRDPINGQRAAIGEFQAATEQGVVQGLAAYIAHGGQTYQLIGYTPAAQFGNYAGALQQTIGSFGTVTDRDVLAVKPQRIDIVRVERAQTLAEFADRVNSPVPAKELSIINQVPGGEARLAPGMLVKRVVGEALESSRDEK